VGMECSAHAILVGNCTVGSFIPHWPVSLSNQPLNTSSKKTVSQLTMPGNVGGGTEIK